MSLLATDPRGDPTGLLGRGGKINKPGTGKGKGGGGGGGGNSNRDPYFNNVELLLHLNTYPPFVDSSKNAATVTFVGGALDAATKKFGAGSYYSNSPAVVNHYLTLPWISGYVFGTGDFTVEAWVRFENYPALWTSTYNEALVSNWRANNSAPNRGWQLYVQGTASSIDTVRFYTGLNECAWTKPGGFSLNTWYHLAVSRQGSSVRGFVDGTQIGTTITNSDDITPSGTPSSMHIGRSPDLTGYPAPWRGWIDDLRITKGVARYTSDFGAPSAQFPDS